VNDYLRKSLKLCLVWASLPMLLHDGVELHTLCSQPLVYKHWHSTLRFNWDEKSSLHYYTRMVVIIYSLSESPKIALKTASSGRSASSALLIAALGSISPASGFGTG
jgi:hypothetical protein